MVGCEIKRFFAARWKFSTGAAALGGLGVAALSGCAPKTLSSTSAVDEDGAEAEAAADWLGEAPVIAEDDIAETVDVDVLCVGASNGGLVAAARLAELGSRVTWVQVFDSTWQEQIAQFRTVGCSRIVDPGTMPGWQPIMPMEAIMGMFQGYLDAGIVKQADSIEELAAEMGADPAVLTATVNRYNELCEAGEDVDFYKESSRMLPIGQPPFYAVRLGGMLMCTCNGLTIDDDMRVLNADGEAIKGLYATGNDSGGMFARHYPSRMSGLTMGRAVTFSHHIAEVISA